MFRYLRVDVLVLPPLITWAVDSTGKGLLDGVLWGSGVRLFAGIMLPSAVNSFGHMTGSRLYTTDDQSRNVPWLAWLTLGEGWHYNHHAFPASATMDHRWWQVDVCGLAIRLLGAMGLVTDIRTPRTIRAAQPAGAAATLPTT
jgi:stearoyl-CoA desaturase (Delta-9 desaturase)